MGLFSATSFHKNRDKLQSCALNLLAIVITLVVILLLFYAEKHGISSTDRSDASVLTTTSKFTGENITSDPNALPPTESTTLPAIPVFKNRENIVDKTQYVTVLFGGTCAGGRLSNRLFEMLSLYGIARSTNRTPYANMNSECIQGTLREMQDYFPRLVPAFLPKMVHYNTTNNVSFGDACCSYDDVSRLSLFNASQYIHISGDFLQSYKYFHPYKADVLKLLEFTKEDIAESDRIANETFQNNHSYRVCVHIRRGDYVGSNVHQESTEEFTKSALKYVRDKVHRWGRNTVAVLSGEDQDWMTKLLPDDKSVHVPKRPMRPTVDYALFARHCNSIILTASASTFGFWSAYLSSADFVYFNKKYARENSHLVNELKLADFYPPEWIMLDHNTTTNEIVEEDRTEPTPE